MNYHQIVKDSAEWFEVPLEDIMTMTITPFSIIFELKTAQTDYKGNPKTYTETYLHEQGIRND